MRIPTWLIPPVIVVCFFGVLAVGLTWELPTMHHDFSAAAPAAGEEAEVQMIVDGLRCRGTSNFFVAKLQRLPGVLGVDTFVQEHRAVIKYDAAALSTSQIQQKIEQPVQFKDGTVVKPFTVKGILK